MSRAEKAAGARVLAKTKKLKAGFEGQLEKIRALYQLLGRTLSLSHLKPGHMGCLMVLSVLLPWRPYLGGTAVVASLFTGSRTSPFA